MSSDPLEYFGFLGLCIFSAIVAWGVLCRESIAKRRLTIADLFALVLYLGIMLGIASYFR